MINIKKLVRDNIRDLVPYSSAREEYSGRNAIFLDANENPFNAPINRYPDPLQNELKEKIASLKNVRREKMFLGNGSDEAIDLLIRVFCEPGQDNIISISPSYGMYEVCADINNVEFRKVLLTEDFQLDVNALISASDKSSKLLFLCSPNNPTSNCFKEADVEQLLKKFKGLIILDEAYIDFSETEGFLNKLNTYTNLVILQTFSKAWAMAGIRLGMCFADPEIIGYLNKVKYPYNINYLTQQKAIELWEEYQDERQEWIRYILQQKNQVIKELKKFDFVEKIYPSDANFLLVRMEKAREVLDYLREKGVIIRDRTRIELCEGCVRITIGLEEENRQLMTELENYAHFGIQQM